MTSDNPPQSHKPAWAQQQSPMPRGSAQAASIMSLTVLPLSACGCSQVRVALPCLALQVSAVHP